LANRHRNRRLLFHSSPAITRVVLGHGRRNLARIRPKVLFINNAVLVHNAGRQEKNPSPVWAGTAHCHRVSASQGGEGESVPLRSSSGPPARTVKMTFAANSPGGSRQNKRVTHGGELWPKFASE